MAEQLQETLFKEFTGKKEEIIPLLQKAQEKEGFLSKEAMKEIAAFVGQPESRIYGVATFYAQFRFSPIGKEHIMVCRGTACHVKGADSIREEIERTLKRAQSLLTTSTRFRWLSYILTSSGI